MTKLTLGRVSEVPFAALSCLTLLLISASPLGAQPTLQITSPVNGATVAPGQVLNITVSASGGTFLGVGVLGTYPFPSAQPLAAPPYQFSVQIPALLRLGSYNLTAWGGVVPGQPIYSAPVSINVVTLRAPTLTAHPSALNLRFVGDQAPLQIIGTLSDGRVLSVTQSPNTTYVSGSPSIATVTAYGVVTATGPGSTVITVNNTLNVPVNVPQPVSVVPPLSILHANQSQQFTATVAAPPPPGSVTWSASPSGVGTLADGLYTAPPSIPSQQVVTITATSAANGTQSASASVLLYPPASVNVAPASATLGQSQTQQFTATVANVSNGNMAVAWSISPSGVGTVDSTGLYTAPASIASTQTVLVTATSVANGSVAASASVTLTPP